MPYYDFTPDYFSAYDIACAALVLFIIVFVTMAIAMGLYYFTDIKTIFTYTI